VSGTKARRVTASLAAGALLFVLAWTGDAAAATRKPSVASKPVSQFFEAGGVKLRYLVDGIGEPVVLLHGLHATAYESWQKTGLLSAVAKAGHRAIALDLPGHGESDKPDIAEAYGKAMVEDVRLLLDHLGIAKAHIVGHSLGALVAMKFVALHPDRVLTAAIGAMGWMRDSKWLQGIWERLPVREAGNTSRTCIRSIEQLEISKAELESIKAPTAVILGDKDPVRRMYISPLKYVRKDWPVIVIEGGGQATVLDKKQFRDELLKWLKRN